MNFKLVCQHFARGGNSSYAAACLMADVIASGVSIVLTEPAQKIPHIYHSRTFIYKKSNKKELIRALF
jgi:hypothetical protein